MADRDDRIDITKEQFFSSLDASVNAEVRAVIENLIKWSHDNDLIEKFTTGEHPPAFTPLIQRPKNASRTFYVQADRWIVIPIRWMNNRPPFSDPAKCLEIVHRIEVIPGSVIEDKASNGFPKFPISSLTSPDQFNGFIETLSWIVKEFKDCDLPSCA